tara:strand:+ start:98 stop:331 length:234 start_codon:yes stop_codon:yes gene_type:complete
VFETLALKKLLRVKFRTQKIFGCTKKILALTEQKDHPLMEEVGKKLVPGGGTETQAFEFLKRMRWGFSEQEVIQTKP